jgi:hypothetical protein
MIQKNIRDYLSKTEQKRFDAQKLSDKYIKAEQYRSEVSAEEMIEVGIRIWMEDFQNGVYGNADETQDWINIVWDKLYKKISRMIASDIDVTLENVFNRNILAQNMLEKNINYALDYFKLLRKTDQALLWKYFCGFGCVKVGWDKWDTRQGWETGIPQIRNIDIRTLYLPANIQQDYMEDIDIIFEQVTYNKDLFYDKLRSGAMGVSGEKAEELIEEIETNRETNNLMNHSAAQNLQRNNLVNVVICQYKKPEYVTVRKIKSYIGKDQTVYEVLEEELTKEIGKENLSKATDRDDDTALPEGMRASEPEVVKYNSWYEVMFIPATNTVICEPECIGDSSSYIFIAGTKNPNSSYPISDAFRQARPQDIFNRALTHYLVHALMHHRSIPAYIREGIVNFDEFMQNYEEQDIELEIEEDWAERNPGQVPFKYLPARPASPALTNVLDMMQMAIGEGTASTPILSGESPGTHVSGTAINSLTNNALDSSKSEFYPYQLFLSKICEKLKEYIAEYKNYVHIDEYFGMEVLVNANADTQMLAAAPNCYITVVDATGNEDAKEIEAQRYERLLLQQIVPYEIAIQKMNLDNPDEIISLHKKQEPIYNMVKQLEDRPELIPRLIAIVDQMIAQGEIPEQEAPQQPQQMAQ